MSEFSASRFVGAQHGNLQQSPAVPDGADQTIAPFLRKPLRFLDVSGMASENSTQTAQPRAILAAPTAEEQMQTKSKLRSSRQRAALTGREDFRNRAAA
jgi:hypothetical protein